MMPVKKKDEFAQLGYVAVTQSAANALTFNGLAVFSNILTPKAIVIHRIEYELPIATQDLMTTKLDLCTYGMSGDDTLTSVLLDDAAVYDYNQLMRIDLGTAASGHMYPIPTAIKDYTGLPGGGLILPADRIYIYLESVGLATPGSVSARFWFTMKDLNAQQYIELAQALRVLK